MDNETRLGFIGIVLDNREVTDAVNHIIGEYSPVVKARIGVPNNTSAAAVIGLIVEGDNLLIGSLTAKLGNLKGVQVKSALAKQK